MRRINITNEDIENLSKNSVNEQKQKKVSTESEEYKKLLEELDKISKKYEFPLKDKTLLDEKINLERKTFEDIPEETLVNQAKDSLENYKNVMENNIENASATKKDNLIKKMETLKIDAENDKKRTSNYFDQAKDSAENDALKRGLGRSSIIINTLSAFDQNRIDKLNQIDKTLTNQIEGISDQMNLLSMEKEKAIKDFNIEYATKLNNKIKELKTELQNRKDEVTEYNNKIAQIEKEYNANAIEKNNDAQSQSYNELLDRVELFLNNGEKMNEAIEKENYRAITNFLYNLDTADALAFLQNNNYLRKMLGGEYSAVIAHLKRKG